MSRRHSDTDISEPSWDSSPITRPTWAAQLAKWLPRVEPAARTMWTKGYFVEKGIVYTLSVRHALDLYHNNVSPQTFDKPVKPGQYVRADPEFNLDKYVVVPSSAPAASEAVAATDEDGDPVLEDNTIRDADNLTLPSFLRSRYKIRPETLADKDERILDLIIGTIDSVPRGEALRGAAMCSGLRMIESIHVSNKATSNKIGSKVKVKMQKRLDAGLDDPTMACFDEFRHDYELLNNQVTGSRHASCDVLATDYCDLVRRLA